MPLHRAATLALAALLALTACSASPEEEEGDASGDDIVEVDWTEARDRVGDTVRACGPVAGVGRDADDTFLNIGKDHPEAGRLVIVVWDTPGFSVPDGSQRACATGEVTLYEGVAQVEVRDQGAVEFASESTGRGTSGPAAAAEDATDDEVDLWAVCEEYLLPAVKRFYRQEDLDGLVETVSRAADEGDPDTIYLVVSVLGVLSYLQGDLSEAEVYEASGDLDRSLGAVLDVCRGLQRSDAIIDKYEAR